MAQKGKPGAGAFKWIVESIDGERSKNNQGKERSLGGWKKRYSNKERTVKKSGYF